MDMMHGLPNARTLGHRQAPAFVKRGKHREQTAAVQHCELCICRILDHHQFPVEMVGVRDLLHQIIHQPADVSCKNQCRHPFGRQILQQTTPNPEQQRMVLRASMVDTKRA